LVDGDTELFGGVRTSKVDEVRYLGVALLTRSAGSRFAPLSQNWLKTVD
jgi:hypothetical protein